MSLHTSFLRVIRHHDALSRLHSRLPLVNRLTDYTVASPVDAHASSGGECTGNATGDRFDSSSNQPQSFGDFAHGHYTGYDSRTPS